MTITDDDLRAICGLQAQGIEGFRAQLAQPGTRPTSPYPPGTLEHHAHRGGARLGRAFLRFRKVVASCKWYGDDLTRRDRHLDALRVVGGHALLAHRLKETS